jgi:hypothetical protein
MFTITGFGVHHAGIRVQLPGFSVQHGRIQCSASAGIRVQLQSESAFSMGRNTHDLSSAYLGARGEVRGKYDQEGSGSAAYKTFEARTGRLFSDPGFRQSVFEKYGLTQLPARAPATSGGSDGFILFPERIGDRTDAEIKAAFFEAVPIWGGTLLAMSGLAWVLMRSAGDKTVEAPPPANSPTALPQLPENLRTVSVAGRRYEVMTAPGQVLDTAPSAHSSGTDLVWVRTPDRRETSLTLPGDIFKTRPYFVLTLGSCRRWIREFRLGSLLALVLPLSIAFFLGGAVVTAIWVAFEIPVGPDAAVSYALPPVR